MSARPIRTVRVLSSRQRKAKKRTLYAVQSGQCARCRTGRAATDLVLKHRVHRKAGGGSTLANLHLICHPCNRRGHAAR